MRKALHLPLRHLLIWCMALLLPLQGLAAGAGLHCVAMAVVATAVADTGTAAHPCHGAAEAAGVTAHHDATAASPELTAPVPALTDDMAASGHTCSACAACCVAAALPSHSRWTAATVMAQATPVLPLPHRADVTSAGLERPPKAFIA